MADRYYPGPTYTGNIDAGRIDIDVSKQIAEYMPDDSGFSVILMRAGKKVTDTQEFVWYDNEPGAWWTQTTDATGDGTGVGGDVEVKVSDESLFVAKDLVKVAATDEVLRVTKVENGKLTVVRGYSGTAAAAIPKGSNLLRLSTAMEQGSYVPDSTIAQPSKFYNYTQIVRTPFDGSRNAESEALKVGDNERNRIRREKALAHRLDIERTLLFGERGEDVPNRTKTTGGLLYFINSNMYSVNGVLTEKVFLDFSEMSFAWGSGSKLLVASPRVCSIINQFAADRIITKSGENTYGLRLKQLDTFHGTFYIVPTKIFAHDYQDMMVAVDIKNVKYRPYKGADTKLRMNIHPDTYDGWMDEYLTEFGLEVRLEKTHAIATGITG